MKLPLLSTRKIELLRKGVVIPALPLALDKNRKLDTHHQKAILRYYMDAGAGGIAVGVHTTQFEIRNREVGLFRPLLEIAAQEFYSFEEKTGHALLRITGIIGDTPQATEEASLASSLGYDAGLLSLVSLRNASNEELINHCKTVASKIPLIGFYLQIPVGGRKLDKDFWREFAGIENVVAIKIAPFNRYQTLDVIRGVAESGRAHQIALYTGNDDNIVADLLTEYAVPTDTGIVRKRIVGGLLGHWAVWTKKAVELLNRIHSAREEDYPKLLTLGTHITDANAAIFDAGNNFRGVIVGIHEVLRRQGLLRGIWTLNKTEYLFPEQKREIDRVYAAYPELNDDSFVKKNLEQWMS